MYYEFSRFCTSILSAWIASSWGGSNKPNSAPRNDGTPNPTAYTRHCEERNKAYSQNFTTKQSMQQVGFWGYPIALRKKRINNGNYDIIPCAHVHRILY